MSTDHYDHAQPPYPGLSSSETQLCHCWVPLWLNCSLSVFLEAATTKTKLDRLGFSKYIVVISEMLLITYRTVSVFGRRSYSISQMRSVTASSFHHQKSGKVQNPDKAGNRPEVAIRIFSPLSPILILLLKTKIIWTTQQYCAAFEKCYCTI